MDSAFTHNQAAPKTGRIARTVLRSALACALIAGAGSPFAQQYGGGDRRDDAPPQHQPRERFSLPQDRGQRDSNPRGNDDQRRGQQQYQQQQPYPQAQAQAQQYDPQRDQQRDDRRGSGRLTPDERRDLRRQINEAGMDLYQRRR